MFKCGKKDDFHLKAWLKLRSVLFLFLQLTWWKIDPCFRTKLGFSWENKY